MPTVQELYGRWINELWAGPPIAAEIVTLDFVGHWPDRDVHGPDELQQIVEQTRNMLADLAAWSRSPATTSCGSPAMVKSSRSTERARPRAEVSAPALAGYLLRRERSCCSC
jgi:hypothetical protein